MDFSEPVEATAFRYGPNHSEDHPSVALQNGHHRLAAARQTGRPHLPVTLTAVNAKGEKLNALKALSDEIERSMAGYAGGGKVAFTQGNHPDVPDVVYHGTDSDFTAFRPEGIHWFTSDKMDAADYKPKRIVEAHLSLKNPADLDAPKIKSVLRKNGFDPENLYDLTQDGDKVKALLSSLGHDGMMVSRPDVDKGVMHYAAFRPNQIKSATGNQGTFDPNDPDITKAEGGRISYENGGMTEDQMRAYMASQPTDGVVAELQAIQDKLANYGRVGKLAGRATGIPFAGLLGKFAGEALAMNQINQSNKSGGGSATGSLREKALWPSAQAIKAGTGSREAHAEMVNKIKPVSPYAAPVAPASDEQVHNALTKDKQPKAFAPRGLGEGTPVAVRLDIPAYEKKNTWVVSVHHPKTDFTAGEVIGYDSVAHIGNPRFGVHPTGALNIASGKPKSTIATVHGNWKKTTPEDAFRLSQTIHNDPQWRQVGMDPERHSYFYDRETQEPVMAADEALHIGPLVYAKNPVYGKKTDFSFSSGGDVEGEDDGITAYHGSPHSFDSFDISKLGTGMGEQAYGKGLYFGGNEHEAKTWRDASSMDRGSYKLVDKNTQKEISPDALGYEHMREPYKTYGSRLRASDLDYFKYFWTRSADELEQKHIPEYENHGGLDEEVKKMRDNVRHLRAATNTIDNVKAVPQGHMYKVKLRVKPEELLDWHGKLADQNQVIQHIARNVDLGETRGDHELKMWKNKNADRAATGQHLYEALRRGVDENGKITYDAENANKILMAHGLKGIRVHAYGSDSFGSPSHNYVMFHHDPVQVVDKYEYGGAIPKARDVSAALALTRRFTKDGKAATLALKPKGK
jgi:hypothetical protein